MGKVSNEKKADGVARHMNKDDDGMDGLGLHVIELSQWRALITGS